VVLVVVMMMMRAIPGSLSWSAESCSASQTQLTDGVQPTTSSRRMDRGTTGTDDGMGGLRGGFICHPDVF